MGVSSSVSRSGAALVIEVNEPSDEEPPSSRVETEDLVAVVPIVVVGFW